MAVKMAESTSIKSYKLRKFSHREQGYTDIDWHSFISTQPKSDFTLVSAYYGKRKISIFETKKFSGHVACGQAAAYFQKLLLDKESSSWQPVGTISIETIPTIEIVKAPYKSTLVAPVIDIIPEHRELIEALLGDQGENVSEKVIELIGDSVLKDSWPLVRVEVRPVKDSEVKDWQYILLVLIFDSDFDTANKYLHNFYKKLDILTEQLDIEEQDILQRLFFFDVQTTVPIT